MANTPCPGPFDYGNLVQVPDGRYGEIIGWGSPPLEYKVALSFGVRARLSEEVQYHSPIRLRLVERSKPYSFMDYLKSLEA